MPRCIQAQVPDKTTHGIACRENIVACICGRWYSSDMRFGDAYCNRVTETHHQTHCIAEALIVHTQPRATEIDPVSLERIPMTHFAMPAKSATKQPRQLHCGLQVYGSVLSTDWDAGRTWSPTTQTCMLRAANSRTNITATSIWGLLTANAQSSNKTLTICGFRNIFEWGYLVK